MKVSCARPLRQALSARARASRSFTGRPVSVIKSNLEDYLEKAPDEEYIPEAGEETDSAEGVNRETPDVGNREDGSGAEVKAGVQGRNCEEDAFYAGERG